MSRMGRENGPVEILCREIGYSFEDRLERPEILTAFVRRLVEEIADEREMQEKISAVTKRAPSEASMTVLAAMLRLFDETTTKGLIRAAASVHDLAHELNPDEAYPTDHLIDMLSSCASAIRFGLEKPCHSRHAADAAEHIWRIVYSIGRQDRYTSSWQHQWAREMMQEAIAGLALKSLKQRV